VEQGKKSLIDILIVGTTIEDLDIKDLQELTKKQRIKISFLPMQI